MNRHHHLVGTGQNNPISFFISSSLQKSIFLDSKTHAQVVDIECQTCCSKSKDDNEYGSRSVGTWANTGDDSVLTVGSEVGLSVGLEVGSAVGLEVGSAVGLEVGAGCGGAVWAARGSPVGTVVACDSVGAGVTGVTGDSVGGGDTNDSSTMQKSVKVSSISPPMHPGTAIFGRYRWKHLSPTLQSCQHRSLLRKLREDGTEASSTNSMLFFWLWLFRTVHFCRHRNRCNSSISLANRTSFGVSRRRIGRGGQDTNKCFQNESNNPPRGLPQSGMKGTETQTQFGVGFESARWSQKYHFGSGINPLSSRTTSGFNSSIGDGDSFFELAGSIPVRLLLPTWCR